MNAPTPPADQIEFPAQKSPLALYFAVVPLLTAVTIAVAVMQHELPMYLIALLVLVGGGCIMLAKAAIGSLGDVKIDLTGEELVVNRFIGSASYPWLNIESVKILTPDPTFGAVRGEAGTIGIGLFMRNPDRKKEREADAPPDVLIVARSAEEAEKMAKACERINNARRKAMGGGDPRRGGIGGGKSSKGFRKPAVAA